MIKLQSILNEVGEGVAPYSFKQITHSSREAAYTFTTDTSDQYIVEFSSGNARPDDYSLVFYPGTSVQDKEDKIDIITNKGDVFKILSTVVSIVKDFISKNKNASGIKWIGVNSDKPGADAQRDRLYKAYLQKNISQFPNWEVLPNTVATKLRKIK